MDDLQDRAGSSVNGTGTSGNIDTPVTQGRSADVPGEGVGKTIGRLDTLRRKYGADSPEGWECSNAIEMLKSRANATDPAQIACLNANLQRTTERLAARLAGK